MCRGDGVERWNSYRFAEKQREKIYVLDNGKSLMLALSQDLSQNRPAEAREHVRRFHELFFTLSPEKSAIEHNVKRAFAAGGQECVPLLFGLRREGVLQPHHRREHQPSAEGGQRGVRLQRLSLPRRDLRHAENHPAEQRHRAQPRDHLPPAERITVGRQPQRLHHRGFTIIENKDLQTIKR